MELTIPFVPSSLSNTSALYCGDKVRRQTRKTNFESPSALQVEFGLTLESKMASNVNLIERNRIRGWIAIIREGKGFIEQDAATGSMEPVVFSTSAFTGDGTQADLGDEVEFSLRKSSGRYSADNILKVPSTIQNYYVRSSNRLSTSSVVFFQSVLPTTHRGRVVSPVRMISNEDCEIIGRIQKISDDGIPGECYPFSITGVKNKRVILLPKDFVTFSVAVGLNYTTRAVNIVLENEVRKGKVDTVKGQVMLVFARRRTS